MLSEVSMKCWGEVREGFSGAYRWSGAWGLASKMLGDAKS